MRNTFLFILLFLFCQKMVGQKVVDKVIDNEERRKVERARKLYNRLEIFEGEKMLKDLVRQHPNEVYFHEALVQMQRQVLYRIRNAGGELAEFYKTNGGEGGVDEEEEADPEAPKKDKPGEKMTTREVYESLGLDMTNINTKAERFEKNRKENGGFRIDNNDPEEATVTIDSTLLYTEEELLEFRKKNPGAPKINKETQKKLKTLSSFAEIPYDAYLWDMLQNARKATRLFPNADSSSYYLRYFLIDTINVDAEVKKDALALYQQGLEEYSEKEIPAAAKKFEQALEADEIFYSAYLKLGDMYYLMRKDTAAIRQYKLASVVNILRPEPYEKMAMMQYNRGNFTEAAAAIIEAIMKYPQHHYFALLKRIVEKTGMGFESQWVRRAVFPLSTSHVYEEIMVDDKSPWWHYQAAKQDVHSYFDTTGIVRPNEKTSERYLEVYGWRQMLKNTKPEVFPFARAMEKVGFLDCYVLISLFHNDLYGQFNDFSKSNRQKIKDYFYMLINWQDKKYDKLRKQASLMPVKEDK